MSRGLVAFAVLGVAAYLGWQNRYVFGVPVRGVTDGGFDLMGEVQSMAGEFVRVSSGYNSVNRHYRVGFGGIELIKRWEGFRGQVYDANPAATRNGAAPDWTIGYGHKLRDGESFPNGVTLAQGQAILIVDLQMAEDRVYKFITRRLTQSQFDALVSLAFNLTYSSWKMAAARINNGETASSVLSRYVYGGGVKLAGLVSRRADEIALYYTEGVLA